MLLGIDFILAAGIVMDYTTESWNFDDETQIKYRFIYQPVPLRTCPLQTWQKATNLNNQLRANDVI